MRVRVLLLLAFSLFVAAAAARAQDARKPMATLLKQPAYVSAWENMMSGEAAPYWIHEYAKSLDGPPTPVIPVELDGEAYLLGFTCKPNACENNQLFVLFAPAGRDAWGMLAAPPAISWLGRPDQRIQDAITGALTK